MPRRGHYYPCDLSRAASFVKVRFMHGLLRFLLVAVAGGLLAGCASMGAMQRADTLSPGKSQILVETSVQAAVGKDLGGGNNTRWPYLAVHYRRGMSERLELGAGASLLSVKGSLKLRLNDPADKDFAVSVAPEVGGAVFGEEGNRSGIFAASLPLLFGWRVGQKGQVVLGPRAQYLRTFPEPDSPRSTFDIFAVGSSLGVVLPMWGNFTLLPEVSVLSPIRRDRFELYDRISPKIGGTDGVLFQVGLGFLFDFGGLPEPQPEEEEL